MAPVGSVPRRWWGKKLILFALRTQGPGADRAALPASCLYEVHPQFAGLSFTKNGSLFVIFACMQGTGCNTRYLVKYYCCLASYTQPAGANHGLGRLNHSFYFLLSPLASSWHDGEVYPSFVTWLNKKR